MIPLKMSKYNKFVEFIMFSKINLRAINRAINYT